MFPSKPWFTRGAAAALAVGASLALGPALAQEAQRQAEVDAEAPSFTLLDLEGATHALEAHRGKVVVLEWVQADCPHVAKHHRRRRTLPTMVERFRERGVVWLAIASGQAADIEALEAQRERWNVTFPILLDRDGSVAHAYGATNTPHVFLIDAEGILRYAGAIDDDRSDGNVGPTNYLEHALNALFEARPVRTRTTSPYGCPVAVPAPAPAPEEDALAAEPKAGDEDALAEEPKAGDEDERAEEPKAGDEDERAEEPKVGDEDERAEEPEAGDED